MPDFPRERVEFDKSFRGPRYPLHGVQVVTMKFLSVCSGIEAASVAWAPLGWKAWAFSEIEPFPCSLLAHHYPDVPNLGDMTKYQAWPVPHDPIDLLCGGTPCQSFSVAGLRKGLDDPRGNLMLTYLAIARKYRPRWLVWENVPGVLSSNGGRDFGAFLWALGQLGYGWAYRILDAQYFGVAQRRRRVFVVAYLGNWQRAAAVLFERHSLQGYPAPRRETGQGFATDAAARHVARDGTSEEPGDIRGVTGTISARTQGGGGLGTDFELDGGLIPDVLGTLDSECGGNKLTHQTAVNGHLLTVPAVSHSLRGDGFDTSEDGTGRGTPLVPVNAIGFHGAQDPDISGDVTHPMAAQTNGLSTCIAFYGTQITSAQNRSNPHPGDPCHTLAKGAHAPSIAFTTEQTPKASLEAALTLTKQSPTGGGQFQCVATAMQVRRLTPRECERLQGFPDDYTLVPHRNKPAADGPRYKALGNSWAVPCARWIGERIAAVDAITEIKQSEAA